MNTRMKERAPSLALALVLALTVAALLLLSGAAWAGGGLDAGLSAGIQSGGTPEMQSIHPVSNTHTAPLTTSVSITYDEPMSATTVSTATFAVHAMQTGLLSQTYGVQGGTIVLTPTSAFKPGELMQASATTGTVNITGTGPLSPTVWQFRAETLGGSGRMLFKNNVDSEELKTREVALGDLDGDGNLDLVVVNGVPTSTVHLGKGDGTFDDGILFGSANDARAVALGDLDGDGDLDIVRGRDGLNEVCLNDATIPFSVTCHSEGDDWKTNGVALGDMDGDGDLDMILAIEEGQDAVLFNKGDGTFTGTVRFHSANSKSYALALGDLDGDGDLDVVIGRGSGARVFLNNGDGTALGTGTRYGPNYGESYAVALGDLDGDGDLDIVYGRHNYEARILLNDGDGTFDTTNYDLNPNTHDLWGVKVGDLDGDGDLDVVSASHSGQHLWVCLNDGAGMFPTSYVYQFGTMGYDTRSVVLGDLNGDGDLDSVAGNWKDKNKIYLNRHRADVTIKKTVAPGQGMLLGLGQTLTYTLEFKNAGVVTATGVVITDIVPASFTNWTIAGNSGAAITPIPGYTFAWTVADLAPGEGGVIILTGQTPVGQCGPMANTATITTTSPEDDSTNNQAAVISTVGIPLYVESIDPGASLTVNGDAAPALSTHCLDPGETVTLTTSFDGEVYYDVVEAHYPLSVAVRVTSTNASQIYLDEDMGYTPYDIYVIHNNEDDYLELKMSTPPTDAPVKIIGLHLKGLEGEWFELYGLGDPAHTGEPVGLADIFYGTVGGNIHLDVTSTCQGEVGSAFNKIVADEVWFENLDCSAAADLMVQELYAYDAYPYDTEISWWHMVVTGHLSTGYPSTVSAFEGYGLNDELPELDTLEDDPMVWFKARNLRKWALPPLTMIGGEGYENGWDFDNKEYGDYNFWETHLGGDFSWYHGPGDALEYAHFLGPVMQMDRFIWTPNDRVCLSFFGDNSTNYDHKNRFDGDYGTAGKDFWKPLLTTDYGYTKKGGDIVSPIFVWRLREGYFEGGWYTTNLTLKNGQDLLILSDSDMLEFNDTDPDYGIHFFQGDDAHWVVEDGLTYSGTVPTDEAFNITVHKFITSTDFAPALVVTASNDYAGGGSLNGIHTAGDDTNSTIYLAYREVGAYGQQLTKVPMQYSVTSSQWSVGVSPPAGVYDFYIVATENDGDYGKVIERLGVCIVDVIVDESPPVADAGVPQEVVEGQVVQLDGSGSYDPDGHEPLTYGWLQTGGTPAMSLSDNDVVSPTFTASSTGTFTFTLTVTDTVGRVSTPDMVTVTVTEEPPTTYGLALAPDGASSAEPGTVVTYSHVLTNTGNGPDTFDLALTSSQGWATMDEAQVSLGAGQTATLEVRVAVPAAAVTGTVDVAALTATSQGGGMGATVTDTTTTTVVVVDHKWRVYLPMIMKQH